MSLNLVGEKRERETEPGNPKLMATVLTHMDTPKMVRDALPPRQLQHTMCGLRNGKSQTAHPREPSGTAGVASYARCAV